MTTTPPGTLTIRNALIFDGETRNLIEGSITVREGRITEVGRDVEEAGKIVDADGRTVIPGLIDAHFHAYALSLTAAKNETGPLSYSALAGARRLGAALNRGFTSVRDVAGGDIGLANAIDEGLYAGPRYFFTGPALSQTGGHGDIRAAVDGGCFHGGHMCEVVDGEDELLRAVRNRFRTGATAIKLMTSGGVISPVDPIRVPQYSSAEIRTVTEEASRRGSYATAHAYSPEAIRHSVLNGVRCIEHGNLLDAETARLMADNEVYLVPTLATYDAMARRGEEIGLTEIGAAKNREVLNAGRNAVVLARDAGVRIGFGTDLMGELEDEQLAGLRLQCEALGVYDALRSATSTNAALLRRDDLGRIAEGAFGDLVILDGNPVDEPSVLWDESRTRTVIKAGQVITRQ
ncbi:metal-dependent hydrolase family protein [Arthrobacter bambusae]|uniref:Imidazolonepropionase-like amidohydrolase n=1 Tax=Arthrobacter bambusae TaxID=1338426 RepID=A0AAW8DMZ6_9MICC|nr:amidohydrolase family protein [Arthrobacter bambusae]MDP9907728.1 imidazolonepropionase-like amidohydrolase [Arthrobacter bambusae]MDQ0131610.1 imidazolonepropionase-like amidohydrolase [Arthrobacter bambusae]MDQ0183022.1 imidazolonepropionase-like amidohydrolase [Arthrobacter bambusae]